MRFLEKNFENSLSIFIVGTIEASFNSLDNTKEFQRETLENMCDSSSAAFHSFGCKSG
jgi:hypothetical protein